MIDLTKAECVRLFGARESAAALCTGLPARNRLWPTSGIDPGHREGVKGIAMAPVRLVLFVRGGGAGAHDEWYRRLAGSLRRELGGGYSQ